MPFPPHRPLGEPRFVERNGEPFVFFEEDPAGLTPGTMQMPMLTFFVYAHLDGTLDAQGVSDAIDKTTGGRAKLPPEVIEKIVAELDRHFLLQNERTAVRRAVVLETFAKSPSRPAKFVPVPAEVLTPAIDEMYRAKQGAGPIDRARSGGSVRGIVAPHIDFHRGGPVYTHAYKQVAESAGAETYLVLGVAHRSPPSPFVLSTKAYETPLGTAEVDVDFTERLLKRAGRDCLEHEIAHLGEHSVEFQAVQLKHARAGRAPFKIVPILCSMFDDPAAAPVSDFISALEETMRGRSICVVAGVDFAHVGPNFGDEKPVTEETIDWICKEDRKSLAEVAAVDAGAFWQIVTDGENKLNVCGLTATYTALRLLAGTKGELLCYSYAPAPKQSVVSFASAVFR